MLIVVVCMGAFHGGDWWLVGKSTGWAVYVAHSLMCRLWYQPVNIVNTCDLIAQFL